MPETIEEWNAYLFAQINLIAAAAGMQIKTLAGDFAVDTPTSETRGRREFKFYFSEGERTKLQTLYPTEQQAVDTFLAEFQKSINAIPSGQRGWLIFRRSLPTLRYHQGRNKGRVYWRTWAVCSAAVFSRVEMFDPPVTDTD